MEEDDDSFVPLTVMPTSRLNDVVQNLSKKNATVCTLDALLPPGDFGLQVLLTVFHMMPPAIKTISLRNNLLSSDCTQALIAWVESNDHIQVIYLNATGSDMEKAKPKLKIAWKKNSHSHRYFTAGGKEIVPPDDADPDFRDFVTLSRCFGPQPAAP